MIQKAAHGSKYLPTACRCARLLAASRDAQGAPPLYA
jgi:hypothetical protein